MGWSLHPKRRAIQKINGLVEKTQNKLYFLHLIDILNDILLKESICQRVDKHIDQGMKEEFHEFLRGYTDTTLKIIL